MAIDRRSLLMGAAGFLAAGHVPPLAAEERDALYAAARREPDGAYAAAIFDAGGRDVRTVALPGRGHDITVSPVARTCVVFARRPGNFAVAFHPDGHRAPVRFTTPEDRHFYGHGVFSADGRLLYATENDFEGARGVIGVYDAQAGYRRVGEFSSGGVGPHDLALMDAGRVLVIANGGLIEHPDFGGGRRVLNAHTIESTLAYVDLRTGALLERHSLGTAGNLSLRHLDVTPDGTVIVGAQAVHRGQDDHKLVYVHRRQKALSAMALPAEIAGGLSGYISSVACDRHGEFAALTSARGALAVVLDVRAQKVVRTWQMADVSGIAPAATPAGFLATSGTGRMATLSGRGTARETDATPWIWDNHAVLVTAGDV